ncbi:FixH family protein [Novosphingobium sp. YJ-S2-02]|uniref:FixH family protein n=1 Tax=Novosphingobium aureum TaxID=2792964 RepID=A0A931MMJ8_9SPHN|nr:FixH family protein [Novosphingobium aureum]MBH0115103.1 FixH family protein [Novosphingobium aureum]
MKRANTRPRPFTGKHMTMILVGGFGIVVAVNFAMAGLASSTFGGVVVENSYVASQNFNTWLDEARQEGALGWGLDLERRDDDRIAAHLHGVPEGALVSAEARHPLGRLSDELLHFDPVGGTFVSDKPLPAGRWTLRLRIEADGKTWREEREVL